MAGTKKGKGKGKGRGSGGRSGGKGSAGKSPSESGDQEEVDQGLVFDCKESFDYNVSKILTEPSIFQQHFEAQSYSRDRYLAVLLTCLSRRITFSEGSKSKALAVAWARKDYDLAEAMLGAPDEEFALKEVLKAVNILDAGRLKRAKEKKLRKLEAQGCRKTQKKAKIKSSIGTIGKDIPPIGSLSGAIIGHIKVWLKKIPFKRLQFFALHFPTDPWKKLADILHLHPTKDIPQCPWFLPFAFGKEIPEGAAQDDLTPENISTQVLEGEIDYTIARKFKDSLSNEAKLKIAEYTPVNTILWYYEELECPGLSHILKKRLDAGEKVSMSYGKLMERLVTFVDLRDRQKGEKIDNKKIMPFIENLMEIANVQLESISLSLESPVVVIGDKSSSMDVAIKTSTIIASLLTKIANADLVFFDSGNVPTPFIPKDVKEVMKLSKTIRACNSTNPAASLYVYYEKKKVVKTFIMVTDEEENGTCNSYKFAELFLKYYDEVYPATLVFISFTGYSPHQMINGLKKAAPKLKPLVFDFKQERPDLSKLDHILGVLSFKTKGFKTDVDQIERRISEEGLNIVLSSLKV